MNEPARQMLLKSKERKKEGNGMNLTIRMPPRAALALKQYREQVKPHLSQNAIIVEAIIAYTAGAALERREQPVPVEEDPAKAPPD